MSTLSVAQEAALEKWSKIARARSEIEEFLDWIGSTGQGTWRLSMSLSDALDSFYGIDRRSLESARRALLDGARVE